MGVGERDRTRRKIKIGVIVSRCKMMRARPRSRTRGMRKKEIHLRNILRVDCQRLREDTEK